MAAVNNCLATGLTWCSGAATIADCCAIATTSRLDAQCLFANLQQRDWITTCCSDVPGITCRGEICEWYEPQICCAGGEGLFLPFLGPSETEWDRGLKIILYIAGLGWLFMGVTAAADIFMQGVEVITSTQRIVIVVVNNEKHKVKVQMWNDTVANLTLMALGSSAPEILLSIIELFVLKFHAGVLGPSTIVGSASFNLFIISAICISAIPDGEIRYIRDVDVFCVTAFFSVFAYIWIVIILVGWSPDRVTVPEAAITFTFSILLICLAYLADIGKISFFGKPDNKYVTPDDRLRLEKVGDEATTIGPNEAEVEIRSSTRRRPSEAESAFYDVAMAQKLRDADTSILHNADTKSSLAPMIKQFRMVYGEVTDKELTLLLLAWMRHGLRPKKSRAIYMQEASQKMCGGGKLADKAHTRRKSTPELGLASQSLAMPVNEGLSKVIDIPNRAKDSLKCYVSFSSPFYSVMECDEFVHPKVCRTGPSDCKIEIPYKTIDGTAFAAKDYVALDTVLILAPGEIEKEISVGIIDNDEHEQDKEFSLHLGKPTCSDNIECVLGKVHETTVTIIDDDDPGVLRFDCQEVTVENRMARVTVTVIRERGCTAEVSCDYQTFPQTATPDRDYVTSKGELRFLKYETQKSISIELLDTQERRKTSTFRVVLSNPQGGVTFCNYAGEQVVDEIKTIVVLQPNYPLQESVNVEERPMWRKIYMEQFREAFYANGSPEESKKASWPDFILHCINFPWKMMLALTPPSDWQGGWMRFMFSLFFIGLFTALINDMASLVGCALDIPDAVTAITFVALGTSLPDTLASMMAAQSDTHADASIGNITGSNSVNVFLGMGISWTIGAIYWEANDDPAVKQAWVSRYTGKGLSPDVLSTGGFAVRAGSLSLNVIAFCFGALVTLLLFRWRRIKFGGELGGPKKAQHLSSFFLVAIWVAYVIFASITSIIDKNRQGT